MTELRDISFAEVDLDLLAEIEGFVSVFIPADGKMSPGARRLNRLTKGAIARVVGSDRFEKLSVGDAISLGFPTGMTAETLLVIKLPRRPAQEEARKAGATIAKLAGGSPVAVLAESTARIEDIALGVALKGYKFTDHKSEKADPLAAAVIYCSKPDEVAPKAETALAIAQGVTFTRDLVNEPANVLTTTEFANRLVALKSLGVKVTVLEEADMEKLGMGSFLSVSIGSESPAKLVVMEWNGSGDEAPLALVGKGVVFDTGGISIKPSAGMETMTMDMGGAGVVAGAMKTLALRKAKANVVGLVGIVENMPDGKATRPGDIVKSMKGDTIEIVNTDAEGRLVLADVLWYAQETFKPAGMIDLATLTGACIIALGHDNAAYFANDEEFAKSYEKSAAAEGEGTWRLPLGNGYAELIKTPLADVKNSGGRPAGTITAAEFLKRFVKDETPWIHIDIAGVAHVPSERLLSGKGATGWGVMALNRLVADHYEQD